MLWVQKVTVQFPTTPGRIGRDHFLGQPLPVSVDNTRWTDSLDCYRVAFFVPMLRVKFRIGRKSRPGFHSWTRLQHLVLCNFIGCLLLIKRAGSCLLQSQNHSVVSALTDSSSSGFPGVSPVVPGNAVWDWTQDFLQTKWVFFHRAAALPQRERYDGCPQVLCSWHLLLSGSTSSVQFIISLPYKISILFKW